MSSSLTRSYRSLLREVNKAAIQPRGKRNVAVSLMLRSLYDKQRATSSNGEVSEKFLKDMEHTFEFMKASRLHNELLLRYNPLHDMSGEERVNASARRVGLQHPKEYFEGQE